MGLTPKPMKRIKITGNEASDVIDKMFDELNRCILKSTI